MSDTNSIQSDLNCDSDNAEIARERRKRRSSIYEKNRILANNSGLDESHAMDVDSLEKDWEKSYMEELKKEINDWRCTTRSQKKEKDSLEQKLKNRESLNKFVPSQLISDKEKKFLKGAKIYSTYLEKIDSTTESIAIVEKLQQMTDNRISRSGEILEYKFTATLKKLWKVANHDFNSNYSIVETAESENIENVPYPEPFLQDFSCV